jgi:hypothetical protein
MLLTNFSVGYTDSSFTPIVRSGVAYSLQKSMVGVVVNVHSQEYEITTRNSKALSAFP